MPTKTRRRTPRLATYDLGPFLGVREQVDPDSADPRRYATAMLNMWPVDGDAGAAVEQRPALERWTAATPIALGGGRVQGVAAFVTATTKYTVVFVGGKMWSVTFTSGAEEPTPVFTDVSPAGIAISTTARVEAIMFNDELIVTDGVNRPWRWNGTTASYLTDVPSGTTVRSPTVYYAKIFFVKTGGAGSALPNRSLIWSEELSPDTGYENALYNNYWNLAITDQEPLIAVRGTNDALVYWRETAIGLIQGAVASTFSADGVHDSVSTSIGTGYPWHIDQHGTDFFFLDRDGRPFKYSLGRGLVDLWRLCRTSAPGEFKKASLTTTDRESLFAMTALTAVAHADSSALLAAAPSNGNAYTVHYQVYISFTPLIDPGDPPATYSRSFTVAIDSYDGVSYTQVEERTYLLTAPEENGIVSQTWEVTRPLSVASLNSSSLFRVRISGLVETGDILDDNSKVTAQRVTYSTTPSVGATVGDEAWVATVPGYDLVVMGGYRVPGLVQDSGLLIFDALADRFYGVWQTADEAALVVGGIGRHGTEQEVLVMLTTTGHCYRMVHRSKAPRFGGDFLAGMWATPLPASTAFRRSITSPPVGTESRGEKLFDRVTVEARAQAAVQAIAVSVETNEEEAGTALEPTLPAGVTGRTVKTEAGFDRHGRHGVVTVAQTAAQQATVQPFAFVGCGVEATVVADATPGVR